MPAAHHFHFKFYLWKGFLKAVYVLCLFKKYSEEAGEMAQWLGLLADFIQRIWVQILAPMLGGSQLSV